jgi:hypothetical protein
MQQPTHHDIIRLLGDMNDHSIVEILETGANMEQLEEAAAWLQGENDVMGDARLPLEGPAARVYDILIRDQELARQADAER